MRVAPLNCHDAVARRACDLTITTTRTVGRTVPRTRRAGESEEDS
jgi:hypothetical protein